MPWPSSRSMIILTTPWITEPLDCIVVGGGAAGLSAALVLGRARRRTLVVDAGRPSNAVAHGIGGLLGQDGRPPADLYAAGAPSWRRTRPSRCATARSSTAAPCEAGFVLELADGRREVGPAGAARHRHGLPATPSCPASRSGGAARCSTARSATDGRSAERPLAVFDRGDTGVHRALLLRAWSDDVTLLTNGPTDLDADGRPSGCGSPTSPSTSARSPRYGARATTSTPSCSPTGANGPAAACWWRSPSTSAPTSRPGSGAVAAPPGPIVGRRHRRRPMLATIGRRRVGRGRPQRHHALGGERHRRGVEAAAAVVGSLVT